MNTHSLPLPDVKHVINAPDSNSFFPSPGNRNKKRYVKMIFGNKLLLFGWCLLFVSTAIYCLEAYLGVESEQAFAFFVIHYSTALIYFFALLFQRSTLKERYKVHYRIINLILFLVSAYALNKEIEVFAVSPLWLTVLLVVVCINCLSGVFFVAFPRWLKHLFFFTCGIAMILFLYLSLYLIPLYALSFFVVFALGLSIHSFIPLLICIYMGKMIVQLANNTRKYWISFGSGIFAALAVCIGFAIMWNHAVEQINQTYSSAIVDGDDNLPVWVQVAQKSDNNSITAKVLKTDLIYKAPNWENNFFWNVPQRVFADERKLHDPLVIIGDLFSDRVLLPADDRIKILESQYNLRHQALDRLWSGQHLTTNQVTTNIRVWPKLHLAYTEQFITILIMSKILDGTIREKRFILSTCQKVRLSHHCLFGLMGRKKREF